MIFRSGLYAGSSLKTGGVYTGCSLKDGGLYDIISISPLYLGDCSIPRIGPKPPPKSGIVGILGRFGVGSAGALGVAGV
jgi:hypothetical protein